MKLKRLLAVLVLCLLPVSTRALDISFVLKDPSLGMPGAYFDTGSAEGAARMTALEEVADYVESVITNPGSLKIELSVFVDPGATLASGGQFFSTVPPTASGIVMGDTQIELLTGMDLPGANATLSFNLAKMFYLGSDPAGILPHLSDFRSVALHEITHGLGFAGAVKPDKTSALTDLLVDFDPVHYGGLGELFTPYDMLLVDSAGLSLILPGGVANPDADPGSGVDIASPHAIAAHGGELVPTATVPFLFYDITHLAGSVTSVMNPTLPSGTIEREWSVVDKGILKDMGYGIVPAPSGLLTALFGAVPGVYVLLRRRRRA